MKSFTFYVVFNSFWNGVRVHRVPKGIRLSLGFFQIMLAGVDIEVEMGRAMHASLEMKRQIMAAEIALHQNGFSPTAGDNAVWGKQNAPSTLTRQ